MLILAFTQKFFRLVGLMLITLVWILQSCAPVSQKGAKIDDCLQCHRQKVQEFQQQKFLHASVAEGECRDCHLSHGVANKLVLVKEKAELCYSCHPQKELEFKKADVHYPVEKGDCTKCHDPHASSNKYFLKKTGQALCLTCHLDFEDVLAKSNVHAPVKEGNCGACHESHASENSNLLKFAGNDLCANCHNYHFKRATNNIQ